MSCWTLIVVVESFKNIDCENRQIKEYEVVDGDR